MNEIEIKFMALLIVENIRKKVDLRLIYTICHDKCENMDIDLFFELYYLYSQRESLQDQLDSINRIIDFKIKKDQHYEN